MGATDDANCGDETNEVRQAPLADRRQAATAPPPHRQNGWLDLRILDFLPQVQARVVPDLLSPGQIVLIPPVLEGQLGSRWSAG